MATYTAAITGLVNAALQLVIAFGVSITDAQNAAITVFVNAALVVVALVLDHKTTVTSPPTPKPGV
jgi:hypothetical protein